MLEFVRQRAQKAGLKNITCVCAGFLTYSHDGPPADAIVTSMAFHHLPDFWKSIALERMSGMLKPGGLLYLHDVIFEQPDAQASITQWIDTLGDLGGPKLQHEAATHVREEFSTLDWIMSGLLERAGFSILSEKMEQGVIGTYLCRKN